MSWEERLAEMEQKYHHIAREYESAVRARVIAQREEDDRREAMFAQAEAIAGQLLHPERWEG